MDHPWRVKLRRANEHIDALEVACKAYESEANVGLAYDFDRKLGAIHVALVADREPPVELSAILGDAVQNLRAALDSIAWSSCDLSAEVADSRIGRQVYFPISDGPSHWEKRVDSWLPNVAPERREVFQRFQPWYWEEQARIALGHAESTSASLGHTLHRLNNLANADRHRGVHPVIARAGLPWITSPADVSVEIIPGDPWPVGPGGTVLTWRVTPVDAIDDVTPDGRTVIALEATTAIEPDSCVEQLRTMSRHVAQILTHIEVEVLELVSQEELAELRALHEIVQRAEEDLDRLHSERDVIDRSFMDDYREMSDAVALARARHERRSRELFG